MKRLMKQSSDSEIIRTALSEYAESREDASYDDLYTSDERAEHARRAERALVLREMMDPHGGRRVLDDPEEADEAFAAGMCWWLDEARDERAPAMRMDPESGIWAPPSEAWALDTYSVPTALDLVAEFEAAGQAYAYMDDDGNIVEVEGTNGDSS